MVEVTLEGYKYRYYRGEDSGYWIGVMGYKGSLGRYSNCRVPTGMWRELRREALSNGYSNEDFAPLKTKDNSAKKSRVSKKKTDRKTISIF